MNVLTSAPFVITYAVMQAVALLFLIRLLDLYEHEPMSILAAMAAWGAIGATAFSEIGHRIVTGHLSDAANTVFGTTLSAPVEEAAKGAVILLAFGLSVWAGRRFGVLRFEGITDGIVYGAAVGIGFAFTEDIVYLLEAVERFGTSQAIIEFEKRRDFFGVGSLHHSIFTAAFGAGLGLALWSRSWISRVAFPFIGLVLAMGLHAVNNGLASFVLAERYGIDKAAIFLNQDPRSSGPMKTTFDRAQSAATIVDYLITVVFFAAVALWLKRQRTMIRTELSEEADSGFIGGRDRDLSSRFVRRTRWYWQLAMRGQVERARVLRRLHIELARMALLKWRLRNGRGTSPGDVMASRRRVERLKAEERFVRLVGSSSAGRF